MSAARKLTIWEEPDTQRVGLRSVPPANDNAVQALDDARENSRLGIFVFAHTSLLACEPASDVIAPEKSEAPSRTAAEPGITGKEEDVEVGLQYFGKRYLNPLLGRWISADPLAVHAPGEADLNLYAYVSGAVLKNVDPLGLEEASPLAPEEYSLETHAEQAEWGTPESEAYSGPQEGEMTLELEAEDHIYADADGDKLAGPQHQGLQAIQDGSTSMKAVNQLRSDVANIAETGGSIAIDATMLAADVASLGASPSGDMVVARWAEKLAETAPHLKTPVIRPLTLDGVPAGGIQANKAAGDAWSRAVGAELKATHEVAVPEITVVTESGVKTRLDWVTKDSAGKFGCVECKASDTAPFTPNQAAAFPEIARTGAVVVGKGKPGVPGGTVIPPTQVQVRRP